jgi:protoheme IX farnesyltransferase
VQGSITHGRTSKSRLTKLLADIVEVIKLKQTLLLLTSLYTAFIVGGGFSKPLYYHATVLVIGFASISAVTAINMYFDMDIDALMERTKERPLPAGRLSPRVTLALSALVLIASLYYGFTLVNPYFALGILVGFVFDIIAYTVLLKRRTPLNIIAGAVAGGAPAMGGWAAATGQLDVNALLFSLIIIAWIPAHIWSLATYYRDDYRRARVPMLPAVSSDPHGIAAGIGLGALVIGYAVAGLALTRAIGPISLAAGLAFAAYVFVQAMNYSFKGGDPLFARRMFIRVNMGLALLLLTMIAEKLLASI